MSTKDRHILNFWYAKLSEVQLEQGRAVSAGELARYVGQNTGTAKRYLMRLTEEGVVTVRTDEFPNGVMGKMYKVKE